MNDKFQQKTETNEPHSVNASNPTELLTGVIDKWERKAEQLREENSKLPKFIQSYNAGKYDQLQTCINELRRKAG